MSPGPPATRTSRSRCVPARKYDEFTHCLLGLGRILDGDSLQHSPMLGHGVAAQRALALLEYRGGDDRGAHAAGERNDEWITGCGQECRVKVEIGLAPRFGCQGAVSYT